MQKRRNDVKGRTTLLLALPDEHQLRFSKYETAKELWEAILKTFGGNEATKKTKKNQLKLQYGNFKAEGSETLEKTFNRLQAIVSHLEFMDVEIKHDDLNQKFLTSLAPEWLIGKGDVHTASVPTTSTQVTTASTDVAAASLSHDTICAYIATQSNGSHIKYEDITQINEDDIEEMDIKWNMALLSMRANRFWKKTGLKLYNEEENHALVVDDEENTKNLNTKISKLNEELSDSEADLYNYKRGLSQVEARLVKFKENEVKYCKRIRVLERDLEIRDNKIEYLKNELEQIKKEKESLDNKLTGFENASKDLDNLLGSQRSDKNKEGLGYSAVPPPPAQIYSPPKKDLSWTDLPEFVDDTVTDYRRPTPSINASKCNKSELQSSNFSVFEHGESTGSIMSEPMIKFVKEADCPRVIKINNSKNARKSTVKYAEMYRNISKGPNRICVIWRGGKITGKGIVIRNKARLVTQGYTQEERVDYKEVFAPVARIKAIRLFLAYALFIGFIVYQMDVKSAFLYGTIDEEVYVMQPLGFQDPKFSKGVYKVAKAMYGLHHVPRAWYDGIFLLQDKYIGDILKKFEYSDVRHQVTPKECHLYAVKRIFRYLKGHPKLGLWYLKESLFDLVAYSDSDYGGATQDKKSTTGGCQFQEEG
nr:hypothetical protein [Tanacetum cinerariifolium]